MVNKRLEHLNNILENTKLESFTHQFCENQLPYIEDNDVKESFKNTIISPLRYIETFGENRFGTPEELFDKFQNLITNYIQKLELLGETPKPHTINIKLEILPRLQAELSENQIQQLNEIALLQIPDDHKKTLYLQKFMSFGEGVVSNVLANLLVGLL